MPFGAVPLDQPPYSPGNCTPDAFSGGHNYTGWCGDKPCPVNSKAGVGATVNAALNEGGIDYNCGPVRGAFALHSTQKPFRALSARAAANTTSSRP
eukprot:SAG22_NODE_2455_length_2553_cov_74.574980_3_plen_96_part_00